MKKMAIAMLLTLSMMAFSGCAEMNRFSNWFNTNENSLHTSVHLVTYAGLKSNPASALRVTQILFKVQEQIKSGTITTASNVQTYINNELSMMNLDPADQIIMNDLTGKLQAKIIDTLTVLNLKTPAEQIVEINTILGWVLEVSSKIK